MRGKEKRAQAKAAYQAATALWGKHVRSDWQLYRDSAVTQDRLGGWPKRWLRMHAPVSGLVARVQYMQDGVVIPGESRPGLAGYYEGDYEQTVWSASGPTTLALVVYPTPRSKAVYVPADAAVEVAP